MTIMVSSNNNNNNLREVNIDIYLFKKNFEKQFTKSKK